MLAKTSAENKNNMEVLESPPFKIHIIHSIILRRSLSKDLYPIGLPVKIFKELLPFSVLATYPAHLNLLDLITLTILSARYNYEVLHCAAFSTHHSHLS